MRITKDNITTTPVSVFEVDLLDDQSSDQAPTTGAIEGLDIDMFAPATKTCTTCELALPLAAFAKKRNGLAPKCRACTNEYSRKHYQENKPARIAQIKERKTQVRAAARSLLHDVRTAQCCVACGVAGSQRRLVSVSGSVSGRCADLVRRERLEALMDYLAAPDIEWFCRPCRRERFGVVRLGQG